MWQRYVSNKKNIKTTDYIVMVTREVAKVLLYTFSENLYCFFIILICHHESTNSVLP